MAGNIKETVGSTCKKSVHESPSTTKKHYKVLFDNFAPQAFSRYKANAWLTRLCVYVLKLFTHLHMFTFNGLSYSQEIFHHSLHGGV